MGQAKVVFKLEAIEELVLTVLYSGFIRDEVPVSMILVGPSGAAKSKILKAVAHPCIHLTDSVSSSGLSDIVQRDTKNEKKFIVMPDFNPTLSRRTATSTATIANLLSITADGTVRVDDGRNIKECKHMPMGMLTACTPEIYDKHAKQWFALGLRRRIIPLFYAYTSATESELQRMVRMDKIHSTVIEPIKLRFPSKAVRPFIPEVIGHELEKHSKDLANNLGKLSFVDERIKKWTIHHVVPISPHVTVRLLAMAHALKRGSHTVSFEDAKFIASFVTFTDPQNPRQI